MNSYYKQPQIPKSWLDYPKNKLLTRGQIYEAFGFTGENSVNGAVYTGCFPHHDAINCYGRQAWKVETLIKEARRRIEHNKKVNEK